MSSPSSAARAALVLCAVAVNLACTAPPTPSTPVHAPQASPPNVPSSAPAAVVAPAGTATTAAVIKLGAAFSAAEETDLAGVLGEPARFAGKTLKLRGEVSQVCQKKGCWMELRAGGQAKSGVRVKFKDYAFFVPKDSAGSQALIEGELKVEELEAAMAAHLEGEGATIPRNAAGVAIEVALVASAVELRR